MKLARCCEQGSEKLEWIDWNTQQPFWTLVTDECYTRIAYCPFCGRNLAFASVGDLEALLLAIKKYDGPKLRICFDVDGLLAQEKGAYADREIYETSVKILRELKECGHTIIAQTARYMKLLDGDQWRASERGERELIWWLREKDIPCDEVYLGKCSADIYLDDKGGRVNGSRDIIDWASVFLPVLYEKQRANP